MRCHGESSILFAPTSASKISSLALIERDDQVSNCIEEHWQISHSDVVDNLEVYRPIAVDDSIAQRDGASPANGTVSITETTWQLIGRFPQDSQIPQECISCVREALQFGDGVGTANLESPLTDSDHFVKEKQFTPRRALWPALEPLAAYAGAMPGAPPGRHAARTASPTRR